MNDTTTPATTAKPTMTVEQPKGWTVWVEAGDYFLGDPCYAVPEDDWMPLLESCGYFACPGYDNGSPVGTTPAGVQVLAFSTAYGDGVYYDQDGNEYGVDAGLIGLVPAAIGFRDMGIDIASLGRLVTFTRRTRCSTDGEGRLEFGEHTINTNDDEER